MCHASVERYRAKIPKGNGYFHLIKKELKYFRDIRRFSDVVKRAAYPVDPYTNKSTFPHQYRIRHRAMKEASEILTRRGILNRIRTCQNFESLLRLITLNTGHIDGISQLYFYDVALRIGAKLGKYPKKVYLHCGALRGAENRPLVNRLIETEEIIPVGGAGNNIAPRKLILKVINRLSELPSPIRDLRPIYHIECYLCVFEHAID